MSTTATAHEVANLLATTLTSLLAGYTVRTVPPDVLTPGAGWLALTSLTPDPAGWQASVSSRWTVTVAAHPADPLWTLAATLWAAAWHLEDTLGPDGRPLDATAVSAEPVDVEQTHGIVPGVRLTLTLPLLLECR